MKPKEQSELIRKEAKIQELIKYNGQPCINCGSIVKYVNGSACVDCTKKRILNRSPLVGKKYQQSAKGKARLKRYKKTDAYHRVQNKHHRKHYKEHPEIYRTRHMKYKYKMSEKDYNLLLEEQNFRCASCGIHKDEHLLNYKKYRLCIDHNHLTNKCRGLLCVKCNFALGLLDENVEKMQKLIAYIKKYE